MKHDVNDSLINHNADILIQHYPNTMNERWHEGRSIDVIEEKKKPQNNLSDSEIYDIWTHNSDSNQFVFHLTH